MTCLSTEFDISSYMRKDVPTCFPRRSLVSCCSPVYSPSSSFMPTSDSESSANVGGAFGTTGVVTCWGTVAEWVVRGF